MRLLLLLPSSRRGPYLSDRAREPPLPRLSSFSRVYRSTYRIIICWLPTYLTGCLAACLPVRSLASDSCSPRRRAFSRHSGELRARSPRERAMHSLILSSFLCFFFSFLASRSLRIYRVDDQRANSITKYDHWISNIRQ